jgi:phage terminase small subunit
MHAMYVDSGTREEDSSKAEKPPPWKDKVAHTTWRRILRNAHSSSLQLNLHL